MPDHPIHTCQQISYPTSFDASPGFTIAMWWGEVDDAGTKKVCLEIPNANGSTTISTVNDVDLEFAVDFSSGPVAITATGVSQSGNWVYETIIWRHVVCTYDGNRMKVYVDGSLAVENGSDIGEMFPASTGDMVFNPTPLDWRSSVDDVRIYNFGLNALQAEYLYAGQACIAPPAYDLDGDCEVSLGEVAAIAAAWLEDGFSSDFPELDP